jgi:hypothetical protein
MSLSLEPWAFVAQGVTGAAIERPFEGVVSNEVRARERLLPFQASKEVPDWIRHDRGREKEVPAFAGKTEGGEFRHAFCGIRLLLKYYRIITRR